jgi:hypothetical protein
VDNIFVLHALIDLYFSFGKKLYCTFVDFKKAFDTVWRTGLWRKLQNCEIKGKCFKIIYNMYKACCIPSFVSDKITVSSAYRKCAVHFLIFLG